MISASKYYGRFDSFSSEAASGADPGKNVTGFQKDERRRREPARGVWGHAPPENFEHLAL